jgi:hypothetical protein
VSRLEEVKQAWIKRDWDTLLDRKDIHWLIEQAEKVEMYEKKSNEYTETLNNTRKNRDIAKGKLEFTLKEIKLRKQYESFLKSVIQGKERLEEHQDFEWFIKRLNAQYDYKVY